MNIGTAYSGFLYFNQNVIGSNIGYGGILFHPNAELGFFFIKGFHRL